MRRIAIAAATTALALPGVALAHGDEHRRGEDHHAAPHAGREHHHRHARLLAFHAQAPAATAPSTGAPVSPAPVGAERAGTIASFTGGTLTITLNDGTTVAGKVTPRTEIECHAARASAADNGDGGRDGGRGDGSNSGPGSSGEQPGTEGRDGRDHDEGDDNAAGNDAGDNDMRDDDPGNDDAHDEAERCMPGALAPGVSVREAVLSVGGAGAFWVKLEL
jgi:hypothetical protein